MGSRRGFVKIIFIALGSVPLIAHVGRAFASSRRKPHVWDSIERTSTITCPACSETVTHTMSTESVKKVYHCQKCLTWVAAKHGDHCIYDSYGSTKCPPLQLKAKMKARG
jgi:hypothetical protein